MIRLILFCILLAIPSCVWGQELEANRVRIYLEGKPLDILYHEKGQLTVEYNGLLVREFLEGFRPIVMATFDAQDGFYIVLRDGYGMGVCAGASVYVLRVEDYEYPESTKPKAYLSQPLSWCLGEHPPISFKYTRTGKTMVIIDVLQKVADTKDGWGKWDNANLTFANGRWITPSDKPPPKTTRKKQ